MERLTWMLAGTLRRVARLLPAGRRQWAEALRAEADELPAGWPRLRWLAGGLRLVAREANVMRKVMYWLGIAAVAAAGAWAIWLSWRASPADDPQTVTDRIRVLAGAAALFVLPWAGRRRGWFGPVGSGITPRLVRAAGAAALCGLGVLLVRVDSDAGLGPHGPGPFSLPREIGGVVVIGAALAALAALPVAKARWWPEVDDNSLWGPLSGWLLSSRWLSCRCRCSRSHTRPGSSSRHRGGRR